MDEEWLQFRDQTFHLTSTPSTGATTGPPLGMEIAKLFDPVFKSIKDWESKGQADLGGCSYYSNHGTGSPWVLAEEVARKAFVQELDAARNEALVSAHGQCTAVRKWIATSKLCFMALGDGGEKRRLAVLEGATERTGG